MLNLLFLSKAISTSKAKSVPSHAEAKAFHITSTNTHGFKDALGPLRKQKTRRNSCSWMRMFPAQTH